MEIYGNYLIPGKTIIVDERGSKYLLLAEGRCLQFEGSTPMDFEGMGWISRESLDVRKIYHLDNSNPNQMYLGVDQGVVVTNKLVWEKKSSAYDLCVAAVKKHNARYNDDVINALIEEGLIKTPNEEEYTLPENALLDISGWTEDMYDEFVRKVKDKGHCVYRPSFTDDIFNYGKLRFLDGEWRATKGNASSDYKPVDIAPVFDYYSMSY